MSDKPLCAECDGVIDGEVVWYRPFGELVQEDARTWRFIAQASTEQMPNSLPFHPECFERRTGHAWPPETQSAATEANVLQNHDIVADRQPDGRYIIRRLVDGQLTPIADHPETYDETELYRRLDKLRPTGDTYVRDRPQVLRLVQPR